MDTSENTAYVALIVILLVLSLATIQVALRIYTRIYLLKQLGWDDYSVVVTLVGCLHTLKYAYMAVHEIIHLRFILPRCLPLALEALFYRVSQEPETAFNHLFWYVMDLTG